MKNILLLGGYGFLGTNILKHIDASLADVYRVIVFDKFPAHPAGISFRCVTKTYAGDFSDTLLVENLFKENTIDLVVHAISTTVPSASFNARYDVESNLLPTISLLNAMVTNKVYDIVYLSSGGAIYGNDGDRLHKETDDVFPISSYGVVKLAIEKYLMQYATLYGLRPLILRLSNPYGPWHYSMKQGVCNVALASALKGLPFSVWGDGESLKDYIFVEDFVRILFRLLEMSVHNEVINVGSGETLSVNTILSLVQKNVPTFEWTNAEASRYDVSHFALDTSKLLSLIGDYDFVPMGEGMRKTLEWAKNYV